MDRGIAADARLWLVCAGLTKKGTARTEKIISDPSRIRLSRMGVPGCSNKGGNFPDASGDSERKGQCRPRNYSWAELMKRVWSLDVIQSDRCGGRMRIVCANHPPAAVKSILECLGLPSRPPPIAPATSITEDCATDLDENGARLN
jgi:hypothetical protein